MRHSSKIETSKISGTLIDINDKQQFPRLQRTENQTVINPWTKNGANERLQPTTESVVDKLPSNTGSEIGDFM